MMCQNEAAAWLSQSFRINRKEMNVSSGFGVCVRLRQCTLNPPWMYCNKCTKKEEVKRTERKSRINQKRPDVLEGNRRTDRQQKTSKEDDRKRRLVG
mmetsp:Transcript_9647/g.18758  ORF Transcript_9647/g.18758 Transcript_9647/m.18758 type:complete len:97 (+) Transcript_9647:1303-1593(+)